MPHQILIAIDTGRKTQAILDHYIKEGRFVAPRAPYGYRKADNDCHKLVPDAIAAAVVNAAGTPTPINYAIEHGLKGYYNKGNGICEKYARPKRYVYSRGHECRSETLYSNL